MNILDKYTDEELFGILDADVEDEIRRRGYEFGWHKKETFAGDVYIMVNPAFSKLVKIGYADDVAKRLKSLNSNSGLPDPYHVYATYKVRKRLEDLKLHELIDTLDPDLRHAKNREFYEMSPEAAYRILSAIAELNGSEDLLVLNPLDDDFFHQSEAVAEMPTTARKNKTERKQQPQFRFDEFGISAGSVLTFYDKSARKARDDITATVVDDRHIEYKGEVTSMSRVAQDVLQLKNGPRGTEYWMYEGRLLIDIYQEKYPKPDKRKL